MSGGGQGSSLNARRAPFAPGVVAVTLSWAAFAYCGVLIPFLLALFGGLQTLEFFGERASAADWAIRADWLLGSSLTATIAGCLVLTTSVISAVHGRRLVNGWVVCGLMVPITAYWWSSAIAARATAA
jgi:hypothetical protein